MLPTISILIKLSLQAEVKSSQVTCSHVIMWPN